MRAKKWKNLREHPIPEPGHYLIRDYIFGWKHLFEVTRREDGVLVAQAGALWCQHVPFPLRDSAHWLEWREVDSPQPEQVVNEETTYDGCDNAGEVDR